MSHLLYLFSNLYIQRLYSSIRNQMGNALIFQQLCNNGIRHKETLCTHCFFLYLDNMHTPAYPHNRLGKSHLTYRMDSPFLSERSTLLTRLPVHQDNRARFLLHMDTMASRSLIRLKELRLYSYLLL